MNWKEVTPDFKKFPLSDLCSQMSFSANCWVISRNSFSSVMVATDTFRCIKDHLCQSRVEMGGLLLGRVHVAENGVSHTVVHVTNFARADQFHGTAVSLRMDTDVWNSARSQSKFDEFIVGWYHSHPNLGVFFSGTDRKTQKDFFDTDYSLGLVIDPVRDEDLWFWGGDSVELENSSILKF